MEPIKSFMDWKAILGSRDNYREWGRLYELRDQHISKCGFPIVTEELVLELSKWIGSQPAIDVGCGIGFVSYYLMINGVNITAVDNFTSEYRHGANSTANGSFNRQSNFIINGDALDYINNDHVIIMSWPDYESPFAHSVAQKMVVGQYLVYQGEGYGGCTADDEFHEMLSSSFELQDEMTNTLARYHLQFPGIHDTWEVYKRIK